MSYNGPYLAQMNLDIVFEAFNQDPVGLVLPVLAQVGLFGVVVRAAKRSGRSPNLAGWLLGPAAGLIIAGAWSFGMHLDNFSLGVDQGTGGPSARMTLLWRLLIGFVPLIASLGLGGLLLGGASLSRLGRPHALRLGLTAGLLLGLGGAVEAHRSMIGAWYHMNATGYEVYFFQLLEEGYLLKVWLLRYAVLVATLLSLASWRGGAIGSRREQLRAASLTLGVVAALVLAWIAVDRSQDALGAWMVDPWGPPTEQVAPTPTVGFLDPSPFPHRSWGFGVLEARYVDSP